ncbi:MAG: helix-turn-helix domain-containing protein, partial [Deltaproteobacteria bacterium]|nr:helix-turn-helix domain-containing protein [Deltaproteobacteria bacterium]
MNKNSPDCKNQPTDKSPAERAAIIGRVVNERMPQAYAAKLLGRNIRTVQRMAGTYRAEGAAGLAHGLCGRPSNNSRLALQRDVAIALIRDK